MKIFSNKRTIVFYHIPKTAGTTFTDILLNEYGEDSVYSISGLNVEKDLARYRSMSRTERKKYQIVTGHLSHKLEGCFPFKPMYITFLREPVDQFLSSYFHILSHPKNRHHNNVSKLKDFPSFIKYAKDNLLDNFQSRYLVDKTRFDDKIHDKTMSIRDVDAAVKKIKDIDYAFRLEDFERAVAKISKDLNWKKEVKVKKLNKSERNRKITNEEIDLIKELNFVDIAVYNSLDKTKE